MEWLIEQTAELAHGENAVKCFQHPHLLAYVGDANAHRWRVIVLFNGDPVDLSAATVNVYAKLADGSIIVMNGTGSLDGVAEAVFLDDVYTLGGKVQCVMRVTLGDRIITVGAFTAMVSPSVTDGPIIDPTGVIPDVETLIAMIAEVEGVIAGAVRFDISQSLTAEQKARAKANIGAIDWTATDDGDGNITLTE